MGKEADAENGPSGSGWHGKEQQIHPVSGWSHPGPMRTLRDSHAAFQRVRSQPPLLPSSAERQRTFLQKEVHALRQTQWPIKSTD